MKKITAFMMLTVFLLTLIPGQLALAVTETLGEIEISLPSVRLDTPDEIAEGGAETVVAESPDEFTEKLNELISENWEENYFGEITVDKETGITVDGNSTQQTPADIVENGIDEEKLIPADENDEETEKILAGISRSELEKNGCTVEECGGKLTIRRPYQTKRLIVRAKKNVSFKIYGASSVLSDGEGKYVLQFDSEERTKEAYIRLKSLKGIDSVSVDSIITVASVKTDSDNPLTQESRNRWGAERIESDRYKQYLAKNGKNSEIIVAVIDTGVEMNHPFLKGRLLSTGYDFVNNDSDPTDDHLHGTHCAGIIADNTPDCVKILPVKVMNAGGSGLNSVIAEGIDYAVRMGADIISMSLGGYCTEDNCEIAIAVRNATKSGTLCVVAAGNESENADKHCPARVKECVTVSSLNKEDQLSDFSNYGDAVDIAAPGENIWSSVLDSKYGPASGTSMATPFVAAGAAMLLINNPSLDISHITSQLKNATVDLGVTGKDSSFGAGALDFGVVLGDKKAAETIEISVDKIELAYSENFKSTPAMPQVTVLPTDATDKSYSYKIADSSVTTYDGRNLNPQKIGDTEIVFTLSNGKSVTCKISSKDMNLWVDHAATSFAGGSGTPSDPYLISTAEQLAYISYIGLKVSNKIPALYFRQTKDIDLSKRTWFPIKSTYMSDDGYTTVAAYNYDGDGYEIKGMKVVTVDEYYGGLFAYSHNAELCNINLIDADVNCPYVQWVGGICGDGPAYINNCYVSGRIQGYFAGGILGAVPARGSAASTPSLVSNCRSDADVIGPCAGGIVGAIINGRVENCVFTGTVSGEYSAGITASLISVGGLGAPYIDSIATSVKNCVCTNRVVGKRRNSSDVIVIIVGDGASEIDKNEYESRITNTYYTGNFESPIKEDSCSSELIKVEKINEEALKSPSFYRDSSRWDSTRPWDENYWKLTEGSYPTLINQHSKNESTLFGYREYYDSVEVTNYYGTNPHMAVPEEIGGKPVRTFGMSFFSKNVDVVSVTLPDTLYNTSFFGFGFFKSMKAIEKINLGKGLRIIDETTFVFLDKLRSIVIPDSVELIDTEAFWDCSALEYVIFEGKPPMGVEKAFKNCHEKFKLYYPDSVMDWKEEKYSSLNLVPYQKGGLAAIVFGGNPLELKCYSSGKLAYELYPASADRSKLTFRSSDEKVIAVDNSGNYKVIATTLANAVIYVYYNNKKVADLDVNVSSQGMEYTIVYHDTDVIQECIYNQEFVLFGEAFFFFNEGYALLGWSRKPNDSKNYYKLGQKLKNLALPGEKITLYPVLKPKTYKVKFHPGEASGKAKTQTFSYGTAQKLSANTFTAPKGKYFAGWALGPYDTEPTYKNGASVKNLTREHNSTVNLYAVWKEITYTVKFNANGGSGKMSSQKNVNYSGNPLKKNKFKAPKGKVFGGWALSKKGKAVYENQDNIQALTEKNGGTVTLYAKWVKVKNYKITYHSTGGEGPGNPWSTYTSGKTSRYLPDDFDMKRKGYTFVGWCTDKKLKTTPIIKIKTFHTGNLDLYAKWERNSYSVKFNANGGSGSMKKQTGFKYGKSKALSKNTFKAPKGKVFAGWATKKNGKPVYTNGQKVKNLTSKNGKTVTLYAVWVKAKTYKVKYNANGGKLHKDTKKSYKTGSGLTLKSPTKKGYKFVGWYTDKSCKKEKVTAIKPWETGNMVLYAKWKKA